MKIKNRHRLKSKDIRDIGNNLRKSFDCNFFDNKTVVEIGNFEGIKIVFVDDDPCFMYYNNRVIFTLKGINKYKPKEKIVIIDMGAVKFVTNGADVMSPGIVDADKNISADDQVWVCDEAHRKPLAIGIAQIDGEQMIKDKKGVAIKVLHYVGDNVWDLFAKSL